MARCTIERKFEFFALSLRYPWQRVSGVYDSWSRPHGVESDGVRFRAFLPEPTLSTQAKPGDARYTQTVVL